MQDKNDIRILAGSDGGVVLHDNSACLNIRTAGVSVRGTEDKDAVAALGE